MSDVIVGLPLRYFAEERQHWARPIERLHAALFVDAEDHRVVGRIQVEADDIASFSTPFRARNRIHFVRTDNIPQTEIFEGTGDADQQDHAWVKMCDRALDFGSCTRITLACDKECDAPSESTVEVSDEVHGALLMHKFFDIRQMGPDGFCLQRERSDDYRGSVILLGWLRRVGICRALDEGYELRFVQPSDCGKILV